MNNNDNDIEPTRLDVKLGRGNDDDHPGNVLYRNVIAGRYERFHQAIDKDMICETVIHSFWDVGARFLRQQHDGPWYEDRDVKSLVVTIRRSFEDFTATYLLQQESLMSYVPDDPPARLAKRIEDELVIQDEEDE